jgi:serine acetyltransferase
MKHSLKRPLSSAWSLWFRYTRRLHEKVRRLRAHAALSSELTAPLPSSVVVMGQVSVYGTGNIRIGENVLLYPELHFETQGSAWIEIGDDVVISRGTHIVAMANVNIGKGSMIGEYASIRDANHLREEDRSLRDSAHGAKPIVLGEEVWIGRGAAVLAGVTIGNKATVGANAVVTRGVPPGVTVAGVPASPIERRKL